MLLILVCRTKFTWKATLKCRHQQESKEWLLLSHSQWIGKNPLSKCSLCDCYVERLLISFKMKKLKWWGLETQTKTDSLLLSKRKIKVHILKFQNFCAEEVSENENISTIRTDKNDPINSNSNNMLFIQRDSQQSSNLQERIKNYTGSMNSRKILT